MQGEVGVASPEPAVGGALGPGDLAAAAADHPLQQVRGPTGVRRNPAIGRLNRW